MTVDLDRLERLIETRSKDECATDKWKDLKLVLEEDPWERYFHEDYPPDIVQNKFFSGFESNQIIVIMFNVERNEPTTTSTRIKVQVYTMLPEHSTYNDLLQDLIDLSSIESCNRFGKLYDTLRRV
jgi:hypothetical protein